MSFRIIKYEDFYCKLQKGPCSRDQSECPADKGTVISVCKWFTEKVKE